MKKYKEFIIPLGLLLVCAGAAAAAYVIGGGSLAGLLILEAALAALGIYMTAGLILPYRRLQDYFIRKGQEEQERAGLALQENQEASSMLQDIQLSLLTEQINPHFLYNTLESIRGQALYNDDYIVADMAETLATFFRYSISRKGNVVTLNDEIKNVQTYLKIQQFRFQNNFDFEILMEDEQTGEFQMPKLTLQPIVENALVHGIDTSAAGGHMVLRAIETQEKLILDVKDNGRGINQDKLEEMNGNLRKPYYKVSSGAQEAKGGIALYNINNRIKLMYGEVYGLSLFSTEGVGTEVQITLPKLREEKMGGLMK